MVYIHRKGWSRRWWLVTYSLIGQELARDPRWWAVAEWSLRDAKSPPSSGRVTDRRNAVGFAYLTLLSDAAAQRDDGYLTHRQALDSCEGKGWVLEALLATPLAERPPLVHRKGQQCRVRNCIDASPPWRAGFDYRICGYLKKNPSRAEVERNAAQRADLDDPTLRKFLFDRDVCCRYCRSGPLKPVGMGRALDGRRKAVMEHPDPDRPAGPSRDNVVLGCDRCNKVKGHRTPDEASMVLLPVPTAEQVAFWRARGEQQFDMAVDGQGHPADTLPDTPATRVQTPVDTPESTRVQTPVEGCPGPPTGDAIPAGEAQDSGSDSLPEDSGSGRVGQPHLTGVGGQPIRAPDSPDIWHRRSRSPAAPDPPAGGDP